MEKSSTNRANQKPNFPEKDPKKPGANLPLSLRTYLQEMIEAEIFSERSEFVRCANHLHQMKWLTANEINTQHEFYPYQKNILEKLGQLFNRKIPVPNNDEVNTYIQHLRETIYADRQKRLDRDKQINEELKNKRKSKKVAKPDGTKNDAHYRSHPKYRLYENHLGETRWMTKEEQLKQDEFTEEVLSINQKILRFTPWLVLLIILSAALFYFFKPTFIDQAKRGYLLVQANEPRGELYIDEVLKLGSSLNIPIVLPNGRHHITYTVSGFESTPSYINVEISDQDTVRIKFDLQRQKTEELALVIVRTIHPDAKVFVGADFYGTAGNNQRFYLKPGKYRIALKKENYLAEPAYTDLSLARGDSVNLFFGFSQRLSAKTRSVEQNIGMVEITSDVPEAKIIIDGKDSGQYTDFIFHKVAFGEHVVTVEKEGYLVTPKESRVRLTQINPNHFLHFTLKKADIAVILKTVPIQGKIYLDGEPIGEGEWRGRLSPGKHQVRFENVDFYQTPEARSIEVGENLPTTFTFAYSPRFTITFSPEGIASKMGSIQLGYLDEDRQFHSDPSNAPEILKPDPIKEQVWFLGYAFAYRNPPLNDAITFTFDIPSSVNLKNNLWLKMWGYRTDEKYPLQFTSVSEINISINNRIIQKDYRSHYSIEQASEENFERFRINNLLRSGRNILQISTSAINTTYFALWKIVIE